MTSLMLDDISMPEINYTCSFEKDNCGWDGKGFVRVDNVLPQTFVVQLIHQSGGQTTVERLFLDANRQGCLSLDLNSGDTTILVVSGTTPFTTELASFELEIKYRSWLHPFPCWQDGWSSCYFCKSSSTTF